MEKDYGKPVDVWSCGVIFAELLQSISENCPDYNNRKCIFAGKYCFPLSPNKKANLDDNGIPKNN